MTNKRLFSLITPAYNEEKNLPELYSRLCDVLSSINMEWEWIIVDDHSSDNTFLTAKEIAKSDPRVHVYRFSRNFGSHLAITCGLAKSHGSCAMVMAADLQDPPELIPQLLAKWEIGAQIVWGVRGARAEKKLTVLGSQIYYWVMRHIIGIKEIAATGADLFLIDRKIVDIFLQSDERNNNIFITLALLGFKQDHIIYDKHSRVHGKTGWSLARKIKLAIDSVVAHSYLPIRLFSTLGFFIACTGFLYAFLVLTRTFFFASPVQGWSSLIIVVLVIGGMQMIMLGVLGEYLWRTLDQSRKRLPYVLEDEFSKGVKNE